MAKIVNVDFPCECQNGKLTFSLEKEGLDAYRVAYYLSGIAKCSSCGLEVSITSDLPISAHVYRKKE